MRYLLLVAMGASLAGQTPQYKAPEERLPRAVAPQPVPFSHKAHVAAGSKCVDCHVSVERSARASIPQADRCMLCHQTVRKDTARIRELARIRESGAKIAWVRVYQVPQFVFFQSRQPSQGGD